MRILVLSDIHANLAALETVLNAAEGQYDTVWCLGDVVGYGPRPNECVALIREVASVCVMGNHDWAALARPGIDVDGFNPQARQAVLWTRDTLSEESIAFLDQLPNRPVSPKECADILLTHASPREPVYEYILTPSIAMENFDVFTQGICLFGHTHKPVIFRWRLHDEFHSYLDEDDVDRHDVDRRDVDRRDVDRHDVDRHDVDRHDVDRRDVDRRDVDRRDVDRRDVDRRDEEHYGSGYQAAYDDELEGLTHADEHTTMRTVATVEALPPPAGETVQLEFSDRERLIINPGSVGQPRDNDARAAYAIFDLQQMTWRYERIAYPIELTQNQMRAAQLPKRLIDRLSFGY